MSKIIYEKYPRPALYGRSSTSRLETCQPIIQKTFYALADDGWDISVFCGNRNEVEQTTAYNNGSSKCQWPDSGHNGYPSWAIDAGPWIPGIGIPWNENFVIEPWIILAGEVMKKAQAMNIRVVWGSFIPGLRDFNHFLFLK